MFNRTTTFYLLAFPTALMGAVQGFFAFLSLTIFDDHEEADFLTSSLMLVGAALLFLWLGKRFNPDKIRAKDALLFAVCTWIIIGCTGAIPIVSIAKVSITDGVFESVSAVTTTGATILSGLDSMPKTFLLYRQFLQWLGGLGVVIFVVAVLPMLNVGGMKLLKAETPGPVKDDKISSRVASTAHYLWVVYIVITVTCALSYYFCGMSAFDAIAHSLTTVSTGGFSTHDASMGFFANPAILLVADFFMLAGAINFALHYRAWHAKNGGAYWKDEETVAFLLIVAVLSIIISAILWETHNYESFFSAANHATFHLISFITSTGYGAASFTEWPSVIIFLLVFAGYLGGCAGSTAGGNKIVRVLLCARLLLAEVRKLIHPRGIFQVKYHGASVEKPILSATMAFLFFAAVTSMIFTLLLMATGLDFWSSLTAVAACLNVLGPGFGELSSNFQPVSDAGTWLLSFAMILGRLEYFTVLALFSPVFWRSYA